MNATSVERTELMNQISNGDEYDQDAFGKNPLNNQFKVSDF